MSISPFCWPAKFLTAAIPRPTFTEYIETFEFDRLTRNLISHHLANRTWFLKASFLLPALARLACPAIEACA